MRARIELKFMNESEPQLYWGNATLPEEANVSNIECILSNNYRGYKGLQLLSQKLPSTLKAPKVLDGQYKVYGDSGYKGFISRAVSSVSGAIAGRVSISFYISGQVPEYLYVTFDEADREYATEISVFSSDVPSGYMYENTKAEITVALPLKELVNADIASNVLITLKFMHWSKPHSSVKVTSISTTRTVMFTGSSIIDFECSENSYDTQMRLSPGICEQYADIKLYDTGNILHALAAQGELSKDCQVTIEADADNSGNYVAIGKYLANKWNIEADSSEVTLLCTDRSKLFNKIEIQRSVVANRTLHDLITILFKQARGMTWKYADSSVRARCEGIYIPNNWHLKSDLYTMLKKICDVGLLRMYWYLDTFIITRC